MTSRASIREPGQVSELTNRLTVAALGLPALIVILVSDARASAWIFAAAAAVACWEYVRLAEHRVSAVGWIGVGAAAVLPLLPAYVAPARAGGMLFVVVGVTSMLAWSVALFTSHEFGAARAAHVLSGVLFSAVGMAALSALRTGPEGAAWTISALVTTWMNDAFAYFGGRAVGRRKLWPAVSPHKTWEGLVIGLLGGIFGMLVIRRWLPSDMTSGVCLAIGVLGGLFAPLGDLCKSMLKRSYHVKDASRLLPGHGGMLDRIDGVLFVAPAVWLLRVLLVAR